MEKENIYKIQEVSNLSGVSVRSLHHYDKIGLLKPAYVNANKYRIYKDAELDKLQQILFFKELGFNLNKIIDIIINPKFDKRDAFIKQKQMLMERGERINKMLKTINNSINLLEKGIPMKNKDKFESFNLKKIEEQQKKYEQETKEKYGESDAYKESTKRYAKYSDKEKELLFKKGNEIELNIANLMDRDPSDNQVQILIGEKRQHITDNFYNCSIEIFRGLGELYIQDERFEKNIDKVKPGLAKFLNKAIKIYCDQNQ